MEPTYEKFPGVDICFDMMAKKRAPALNEEGFYWLKDHATEHIEKIIREFENPRDNLPRFWLLELIAAANTPSAAAYLVEYAKYGESMRLRRWSVRFLYKMGATGRKQAYHLRFYTFEDDATTENMHALLYALFDGWKG